MIMNGPSDAKAMEDLEVKIIGASGHRRSLQAAPR